MMTGSTKVGGKVRSRESGLDPATLSLPDKPEPEVPWQDSLTIGMAPLRQVGSASRRGEAEFKRTLASRAKKL